MRAALAPKLAPIQKTLAVLLRMGSAGDCKRTARLCDSLQTWWDALWAFADHDGLEPANNAAERALRAQ